MSQSPSRFDVLSINDVQQCDCWRHHFSSLVRVRYCYFVLSQVRLRYCFDHLRTACQYAIFSLFKKSIPFTSSSGWGIFTRLPHSDFFCMNLLAPMLDNRVLKWWRHKNEISEIMGFVRIFWRNNVQEAYLPKMRILGQIVPEMLAG